MGKDLAPNGEPKPDCYGRYDIDGGKPMDTCVRCTVEVHCQMNTPKVHLLNLHNNDNACDVGAVQFEVLTDIDTGASHWTNFWYWDEGDKSGKENCSIKGYVKWDGCMEFDGSIHLCGNYNVRCFAQILECIHKKAGKLMESKEDSFEDSANLRSYDIVTEERK